VIHTSWPTSSSALTSGFRMATAVGQLAVCGGIQRVERRVE
jgi:hypothetical protein